MMFELVGEEYACDGVWLPVVITYGTYDHCEEIADYERNIGQYRHMCIVPEDHDDDESLC